VNKTLPVARGLGKPNHVKSCVLPVFRFFFYSLQIICVCCLFKTHHLAQHKGYSKHILLSTQGGPSACFSLTSATALSHWDWFHGYFFSYTIPLILMNMSTRKCHPYERHNLLYSFSSVFCLVKNMLVVNTYSRTTSSDNIMVEKSPPCTNPSFLTMHYQILKS